MKVAFDIGGVLSKYPAQMFTLMTALSAGGVEVHVVTDMPYQTAATMLIDNGFASLISPDRFHSADWNTHQDRCKAVLCDELGIDVLIDDRPDYCAEASFIGLVVAPRPQLPYYAPDWKRSQTP